MEILGFIPAKSSIKTWNTNSNRIGVFMTAILSEGGWKKILFSMIESAVRKKNFAGVCRGLCREGEVRLMRILGI